MSKDIRSYFQLKKPPKPVKIEDDDDDVIPESPDVQIKNKKKEARKKRCLSDSDDEIFAKKKKPIEPEKSAKSKKTSEQPKLKEVKVQDLFGNGPLKRTEPMVTKVKKATETGIHSDEEFEKSLLEVDAEEQTLNNATESLVTVSDSKTEVTKEAQLSVPKTDVQKEKPEPKINGDHIIKEDKHLESHKHDKDKSKHSKSISDKQRPTEINKKDEKSRHRHQDSHKERSKHHKDLSESNKKHYHDKSNRERKHSETNLKEKLEEKKDHREHKKDEESTRETLKKDNHEHNDEVRKERSKAIANAFKHEDKQKQKAEKTEERKRDKKTPEKKENGECSKEKKRDFSEFLENDTSVLEDTPKNKRKKMDRSMNDSGLTDEERHERKMHCAALYKQYLNRSGPKHMGAKEIPEGTPDCLLNCAFLLTGVLDSFERDEVAAAITKFGGTVKNSISKKVTHVLAGDDAGPAKMAKAQELGIPIISEDEFLQMIIEKSKKGGKPELETKKDDIKKEKVIKAEKHRSKVDNKSSITKVKEEKKDSIKVEKSLKSPQKTDRTKNHETKIEVRNDIKLEEKSKSSSSVKEEISAVKEEVTQPSKASSMSGVSNSIMWVEKYKPQNVKQIIGQHGDSSNVKKLMNWLTKWYVNRKEKLIKPSPWAKNDDGAYYKAALLSGPPGVGKTTTVALVCKELGFDMVEFNASDTRNKTLIKEQIGELLTTTSLSAYAKGDTGKQAVTKKHVLVMDEVDGMAGNEDRGGLQELISLIKSTSVPIICMCNDRTSQKMRSLVNYCFDLRFTRPRVEQIKSAMMSICCKEGIKIAPEALTQLIIAANQDVRQTLNLLSMWAVDANLTDTDRLKKEAHDTKKDIKLGPFEAVRKVFSAEDHKTMSINDKSDLFFYDYSMAPLFVQENYLQVMPHCPKNEILHRVAMAADSISLGDLVDARIRRQQAWNLLPMQAMYSSVIPGHHMSGHLTGQIQFPGWLGKNSRATKMHRLCQEIHAHTRLSTSGSKSSIFLDYCIHIRDAIVTPLLKEKSDGIDRALEVLESYHLLREDLDSLSELALWPGQRDPMVLIDSKVKAAMTRTYNKKASALPYAPGNIKRGRAKAVEEDGDEEYDEGEEDNDSDPDNDALIKKKKVKEEKPSTNKASSSKATKDNPSTSRKKK